MLCAAGLGAQEAAPPLLREAQRQGLERALHGDWLADVGRELLILSLRNDGSYELGARRGTYALKDGKLELTTDTGPAVYALELKGNQLTLSGADLDKPLVFIYRPALARLWGGLFEFSWDAFRTKFNRILIVAGITLAAWVVIVLLRLLSHWLIFSEWGPLRFIYRVNKSRTETIHRLVLNSAKYVICFVALGYILSELGINYTTYLASLSVFGLAIGFGSQGFVQDMVTGFFIIFEAHFDVGDMVEISGQTGLVQDLGLRMTRLVHYNGQSVTIPNRNIAVVANYPAGGQDAYVDVAVKDHEGAERARGPIETLAAEVARQFPGVVLTPPVVLDELALASGECFVRLHLRIWPGQTWVIDQQLMPRLRETLKAASLENPGDRIVAFYRHADASGRPGGSIRSWLGNLWKRGGENVH
ncbi:MAG: hypothetical protein AMXMBFR7_29440 [Planctomycetota bacterium]